MDPFFPEYESAAAAIALFPTQKTDTNDEKKREGGGGRKAYFIIFFFNNNLWFFYVGIATPPRYLWAERRRVSKSSPSAQFPVQRDVEGARHGSSIIQARPGKIYESSAFLHSKQKLFSRARVAIYFYLSLFFSGTTVLTPISVFFHFLFYFYFFRSARLIQSA